MSIYREQLMDHYKNPRNKGDLKDSNVVIEDTNPFCGDEITLQLKIENSVVEGVAFKGSSCAVSTASASLTTDFIKGKKLEEVENINKDDILDMLGVELTTSRVKCATLVLEALQKAIKNYNG